MARQQGRPVGITGIGMYVPERVLTNQDLERIVDTSDEWIVTRTGIRERRIAGPEESTFTMALAASRQALEMAGVRPEEIDLIVVGTVTPDMIFPSTAALLQEALGASRAAAVDISAACPGFVYGITLAGQTIASGLYRTVLVVGAETLSRITDYQDRNTCVLFGDAAGAAVLQPVREGYGLLASILGSDGSGAEHLYLPGGGSRHPASHETVDKRMHYIRMNGKEVFKFAVRVMNESTVQVLEEAGHTVADLDLLVPHQANIRIIEAAVERLGIPWEKVVVNLDRYGNTSTATIPVALYEALQAGRIRDGDLLVLVSFGAGLVWGATALRWGR
ncbi:beta-ketoacyl-ACP synthase III [Caldinitratiruptor microaerophilus]|uniref:Beta-ketoacyl-[acyl-carrier-protein] synthase III n=1 Tax=Caldinitratiruptor microaerophilus TaxID=671077 RepID=A0AA35CJV7_9FIRM|nr:beta-ketoacyl-ACP synthase III [Caldinitratiruptor microaerophilus]BDG60615.1 3-oxoacyl-ACP synthase III [Caldinitratiruptor microaerophilus]